MKNMGVPISRQISTKNDFPTHIENIDLYLGRVVDSFVCLFKSIGKPFDGDPYFWSEEGLPIARGSDYLANERD